MIDIEGFPILLSKREFPITAPYYADIIAVIFSIVCQSLSLVDRNSDRLSSDLRRDLNI